MRQRPKSGQTTKKRCNKWLRCHQATPVLQCTARKTHGHELLTVRTITIVCKHVTNDSRGSSYNFRPPMSLVVKSGVDMERDMDAYPKRKEGLEEKQWIRTYSNEKEGKRRNIEMTIEKGEIKLQSTNIYAKSETFLPSIAMLNTHYTPTSVLRQRPVR